MATFTIKLLLLLPWVSGLAHALFTQPSLGLDQQHHEWMEDFALNTGCYAETLSLFDHRGLIRAGKYFMLGDMHRDVKAVPAKVRITVPVQRINFGDMTVRAAATGRKGGAGGGGGKKKQDPSISPDFLPLHLMGLLRVAFASTQDLLYLWNDFNLLDVDRVGSDPREGSEPGLPKEVEIEQNRMHAVTIRNEIRTLEHVVLRMGDLLGDEDGSKVGQFLTVLRRALGNIVAMMKRLCLTGEGGRFGLLKDIFVTKNVYDNNEIRKTLLEMLFLDGIKEIETTGLPPKDSVEMAVYKSYAALVLTPLFLRRGSDAYNECALRNSTGNARQVIYFNTTAYGKTDPTVLGIYVSEQQQYTSTGGDEEVAERYSKRYMHSKAQPAGSSSNITDDLSDRLSSYTAMIMSCRGGAPSPPDEPLSSIEVCAVGGDTCSLIDADYHSSRSLERCRPVRFTLFPYNNVIAIAMSLSANIVHTGRPAPRTGAQALLYDSDLCGGAAYSDLPRALIAGLGGGELPSLLALKHSCLVVDVVEVSATVYHAAGVALGFADCGLVADVETIDFADWGGGSCRLNVILSDFLEYMAHISTHNLRKYDFVITDVFNSTAIEWDGTTGTGVSNAEIDRFSEASHLQAVRSILKPRTGLLLTHLHHDSYYKGFFNALKNAFESGAAAAGTHKKYVAVFKKNTNSNVIVAAIDGFSSTKKDFVLRDSIDEGEGHEEMRWPCSDLGAFAAYSVQYALRQGYSKNIAYSQRFAATCIDSYEE